MKKKIIIILCFIIFTAIVLSVFHNLKVNSENCFMIDFSEDIRYTKDKDDLYAVGEDYAENDEYNLYATEICIINASNSDMQFYFDFDVDNRTYDDVIFLNSMENPILNLSVGEKEIIPLYFHVDKSISAEKAIESIKAQKYRIKYGDSSVAFDYNNANTGYFSYGEVRKCFSF